MKTQTLTIWWELTFDQFHRPQIVPIDVYQETSEHILFKKQLIKNSAPKINDDVARFDSKQHGVQMYFRSKHEALQYAENQLIEDYKNYIRLSNQVLDLILNLKTELE